MHTETFFIEGPVLFTPRVFSDDRGFFVETFKKTTFSDATGCNDDFVQDNQSFSLNLGTIRGLHYQRPPHAQGKLVRCSQGKIIDVAVDVRKGSETFGQHIAVELSADNHKQLWVPAGFLHGFSTLEMNTMVMYKCTDVYAPDCDGNVLWNDPVFGIDWGIDEANATLSNKDQNAPRFADFDNPF